MGGDRRPGRRSVLRAGALAVGFAVGGQALAPAAGAARAATRVALAGTDGHMVLPGREPLYVFGFARAPVGASAGEVIAALKGRAQHVAPIIEARQDDDLYLTLTNAGLVMRPDLADSHTIHWHGFRLPPVLFDGVPEMSVSVPIERQLTYFYRPHDPGTYMYHCHFEDVEHVQMGMAGIVFVRPAQDGDAALDPLRRTTTYAYNDGDGSTAYDRHFAILLNEIEERMHDADEQIQEFIPTDYEPTYFTLNGRVYPQTVLPNDHPSLPRQPVSSLIQLNPGDRALLRLANLGYRQHAMQLPGIELKVVGEDATLRRAQSGADTSYRTGTLYLGPGEARDVLFTAPPFDPAAPATQDARGVCNVYLFKNRDFRRLGNPGSTGLGGMATEVRVYRGSPLPPQTVVGETYA
ncbi:multicopper oxidase domain-containing protein [Spongiactinospora sp. TRM90649]|uniref:multicopper oxidase domain-containing protein n=1 Tax=Spongiactinospora sp. TRM90649 TaxID=3031114 RepID=UPI0023F8F324|nr:multicopper oxidase domain-containing protein [Spongiactinospora sp. TRM90649]MDF5755580.1 multicopper oxidase domain-containing protein [Spongiactinospora sp. TRM90649]